MTSKYESSPLRQKPTYAASQTGKHKYTLRPLRDISKVYRNMLPACRKTVKKSAVKSVNNKRITTPRSTSSATNSLWKKKIPQDRTVRKTSNKNVNDFIGDADLTSSIVGMEDDAFQLATYLESDDIIDLISDDLLNDSAPQSTQVDPLNETASLRGMRLEELLDLTIKELQKANNDNMTGDTNQSNLISKRLISTWNVGADNSKRSNEQGAAVKHVTCNVTGQSSSATDRINRCHVPTIGNLFKRRETFRPSEPSVFSVPTELGAVSSDVDHHNICQQRRSSTLTNRNSTRTEDMRPSTVTITSNNVIRQTPYATLTKNVALHQQVSHVFNRACYHYLNGRPCRRLCKWNHSLPSAPKIYHKLMRMSAETVKYMYINFVLINTMAFDTYFSTMCEVFGKRKMESMLLRTVNDCEGREKIPFFVHIFHGLTMAGSSKRDALSAIIESSSKNRDCYDLFLEIIIDTGAIYFIDLLAECCLLGTISTRSMYKLLQQVIEAPRTALLPAFVDILDKYSMYGGFDAETFRDIIPRITDLVVGNLSLSQQLNHIAKRMQ